MLRLLATGLVLLAAGSVLGVPPVPTGAPDAPKTPDADTFIRQAITDGLIEDGAPLTLVSDIAKRDDFLGKCRLCNPSRIALEEYGKRKVQPVAKEGKGLPEELVKRLKSDKAEVRQPALRDLVSRYVDRAFASSDLAREEKTALQATLDQIRKDGVSSLPGNQKFCPSCDGACRVSLKP